MADDAAAPGDDAGLRDRLESARNKRLLNAKLGGKSIAEQLEGDEMDSAAAWINKSRRQEDERKEARKVATTAGCGDDRFLFAQKFRRSIWPGREEKHRAKEKKNH